MLPVTIRSRAKWGEDLVLPLPLSPGFHRWLPSSGSVRASREIVLRDASLGLRMVQNRFERRQTKNQHVQFKIKYINSIRVYAVF